MTNSWSEIPTPQTKISFGLRRYTKRTHIAPLGGFFSFGGAYDFYQRTQTNYNTKVIETKNLNRPSAYIGYGYNWIIKDKINLNALSQLYFYGKSGVFLLTKISIGYVF